MRLHQPQVQLSSGRPAIANGPTGHAHLVCAWHTGSTASSTQASATSRVVVRVRTPPPLRAGPAALPAVGRCVITLVPFLCCNAWSKVERGAGVQRHSLGASAGRLQARGV